MRFVLAAILAALVGTAASAQLEPARSGFEMGRLECTLAEFRNRIVRSEMTLDCEFLPVVGEPETYTGRMTRTGLDLSVRRRFVIVWLVLNPTEIAFEPGSLRGTFVGGTADVSLGAGIGANMLVGAGPNAFTLQPVSIAGIMGAGVALTTTRLVLE